MNTPFALLGAVLALATFGARPAAAAAPIPAIPALLARSADAWNHGKLDEFMTSYENAPTTEYISSKTVIHGYAAIRAHYAGHYRSGMGTLSFSDLSVMPLGDDYAVVVAHWHLAMKTGAHPTGIFSLVLHRSQSGWHIVADHSP
jgi:ketosteroid isomerase-like protein